MDSQSKNNKKSSPEYKSSEIEEKWQKTWRDDKTFTPSLLTAGKAYFTLMMFPYPSAEGLHVGNMYAFTGSDVHGRYMRMNGYDVFEPIGLDGFGIHSENYAIKVGKHPAEQAKVSQKNFYRQLQATGNGYDWTRTLETYDPLYYRWTQWIFIQMFRMGLAYRKKAQVNWCPSDKTVLADEQVIDGKCERDGAIVEKRDLEQWFFRITDYADRLLNNIDKIDWPEKIKTAQRQWIGKKTGINITYVVEESSEKITVFTTRPDTNFGATFIALAPEHDLAVKITTPEHKKEVEAYIEASKKKTDHERMEEGKEKTGVFTGAYAVNDLTGYKMPIWISDFVLMGFGTGALVGVPGHDKRDFEFASKFGLEIIRVVTTNGDSSPITKIDQVQEEEGEMVNSGFLDGMSIHDATEKIMDYMEEKKYGKREATYHLRDWLISRQRYWGPPIPMIYCETCAEKGKGERDDTPGWYTVPEKDLPVLLPEVEDWRPEGSGTSPLANHPEFYETKCPSCSAKAKRETDVSDTFLDSAWYYLRYLSIGNDNSGKNISKDIKSTQSVKSKDGENDVPYSLEAIKRWCPVAIYIGGAEHSVLHLLYVRFVALVLHDLKNQPQKDLALPFEEPFPRFFGHGLIIKDGAKMSKSKGNVVVPDKYIAKFGADTLRIYLMFLGPFEHGGEFRDTGIEGMSRFIRRVWNLFLTKEFEQDSPETLRMINKTVKEATQDIKDFSYNTAIAKLMEFYNFNSEGSNSWSRETATSYLKLFAPFAPHITEELFEKLKLGEGSIHFASWPGFDDKYLVRDEIVIPIQVNGKRRGELSVESSKINEQNDIETKAKEAISAHLEGKEIRKVIYVPGKIINFVI